VVAIVARNMAEFAFGGSLESDGRFFVGRLDKNLALIPVKLFSH
jgi:hypothetical protein